MGTPNEKQISFLLAEEKNVGFGGARGGGKSWVVRVKAVLLCLAFAGIKCMIIRKTYPELQENHIIPLCQTLNCYAPDKKDRLAAYNDSKKHITFPNGSRILFRYCDNEKDAERFQGTEVDVLFIDEATHQSEEKMKKLTACVRGVNGFPKRMTRLQPSEAFMITAYTRMCWTHCIPSREAPAATAMWIFAGIRKR